jgi:C_GCAxxG_C_C family probable redox protein
MIENAARRCGELFESGFYCAESVLLAIGETKGLPTYLIPQIATGFCSGVSRSGGMCGAISGGIMALSACRGRKSADEPVDELFAAVKQLMAGFESKFGSSNCQILTGCDLGTDEGQAKFEAGNQRNKCREYTEEVTRQTLALIEVANRTDS